MLIHKSTSPTQCNVRTTPCLTTRPTLRKRCGIVVCASSKTAPVSDPSTSEKADGSAKGFKVGYDQEERMREEQALLSPVFPPSLSLSLLSRLSILSTTLIHPSIHPTNLNTKKISKRPLSTLSLFGRTLT